MFVFLMSRAADAAVVRVLVAADAGDVEVVDAWVAPGRAPAPVAPSTGRQVQLLDAAGRVLGSAPLAPPTERSVIFPEGGGAAVDEPAASFVVDLPWESGAARVAVGGSALDIRIAPTGGAQATLVQGDGGAGRQDLVFLSEGYTNAQLGTFRADVIDMVAHLGIIEPYSAYTDLFNIWRVEVASNQSGADHPSRNVFVDTAFSCAYDCGGIERLICCTGPVVATVAGAVPGFDGIVVLVNDPQYGGSGGSNYATSYNGSLMEDVAVHEMGHTLPSLWDEYSYGYARGQPTPAPNCAYNPNATPWEHWRDLPEVDAFAACSYTDYYRPTNTGCLMNILQDQYCPVCREHVVIQFYSALSAVIETTSPAEGDVAVDDPGDATFTIDALGPDDGSQEITWTLGGQVIRTGTAANGAETVTLGCGARSGTLTAEVVDPTPWVRLDPQQDLQDTATWSLTMSDRDRDGNPDHCDPFRLDAFVPELAGVDNTWTASGATPSASVVLVAGRALGSAPVPGCPGLLVPIAAPRALATATSDPSGVAAGVVNVPGTMAGRSGFLAVVDRASCAVSAPVAVAFP